MELKLRTIKKLTIFLVILISGCLSGADIQKNADEFQNIVTQQVCSSSEGSIKLENTFFDFIIYSDASYPSLKQIQHLPGYILNVIKNNRSYDEDAAFIFLAKNGKVVRQIPLSALTCPIFIEDENRTAKGYIELNEKFVIKNLRAGRK